MDATDIESTVRVGWFELFYDLVVVASVSLGSHVYAASPSWGMGTWLAASLFMLMTFWLLTVMSHNLYPGQDIPRRLLIVVQMVAVIIASLSLGRGEEGLPDDVGFGALVIAFGSLALVYLRNDRLAAGDGSRTARTLALACGVSAVIMLVGVFLPDSGGMLDNPLTWAFVLGLLVTAVPMVLIVFGREHVAGRVNVDHLNERFGQLVLIVLGESFISLVYGLADKSMIPNPTYFIVDFIVVFAIWTLYFTYVLPAGVPQTPARLRAWIAFQYVLLFGAIASAAGLAALTLIPFGGSDDGPAYWTPLPFFYVMLGILGLRLCGKGLRSGVPLIVAATALLGLLAAISLWVVPAAAQWLTMVGAGVVAAVAVAGIPRRHRARA